MMGIAIVMSATAPPRPFVPKSAIRKLPMVMHTPMQRPSITEQQICMPIPPGFTFKAPASFMPQSIAGTSVPAVKPTQKLEIMVPITTSGVTNGTPIMACSVKSKQMVIRTPKTMFIPMFTNMANPCGPFMKFPFRTARMPQSSARRKKARPNEKRAFEILGLTRFRPACRPSQRQRSRRRRRCWSR